MSRPFDTSELQRRVDAVREKIDRSAMKVGRQSKDILLCAACKAQDSAVVRASAEMGIDAFGENRMQEMALHLNEEAYLDKPCHFIGHLQTNKVKFVAGKAALIQSVGSVRLFDAISSAAVKLGITQDVLIEINLGREESKAGIAKEELFPLMDHAAALSGIRVRGLMVIPPVMADEKETRIYFQETHALMERLKTQGYENCLPDTLSMGMSDTFEWAIEEGATLVRVGRSIYGERN